MHCDGARKQTLIRRRLQFLYILPFGAFTPCPRLRTYSRRVELWRSAAVACIIQKRQQGRGVLRFVAFFRPLYVFVIHSIVFPFACTFSRTDYRVYDSYFRFARGYHDKFEGILFARNFVVQRVEGFELISCSCCNYAINQEKLGDWFDIIIYSILFWTVLP